MTTPSIQQIQKHLDRLKATGFDIKLDRAAKANGLQTAFFFAMASRATSCRNTLFNVKKGGPHGVGIVQVDIRHPIAKMACDTGTWKTDPDPLIEFAARLLSADILQVQHNLPILHGNEVLKVVASGYNCGIARALRAAGSSRGDSDVFTTGKDYGKDVIARMLIIEQLLAN
jgi:hypothetical protein